jgi:hypothetical protein
LPNPFSSFFSCAKHLTKIARGKAIVKKTQIRQSYEQYKFFESTVVLYFRGTQIVRIEAVHAETCYLLFGEEERALSNFPIRIRGGLTWLQAHAAGHILN